MPTLHLVPADLRRVYRVDEWRNAAGVLKTACPDEWRDLLEALREFTLLKSEVLVRGGNNSPVARRLHGAFFKRGWTERNFATSVLIDNRRIQSRTHKVDCFKGEVAVEIEWSAKDVSFDRDLNNFRLLFELRAIAVGVIITRATELQNAIHSLGKTIYDSTTHLNKLLPRLEGGAGGGCPILAFGITPELLTTDEAASSATRKMRRRR